MCQQGADKPSERAVSHRPLVRQIERFREAIRKNGWSCRAAQAVSNQLECAPTIRCYGVKNWIETGHLLFLSLLTSVFLRVLLHLIIDDQLQIMREL
jgi:hypothetical protein